MNAGRRPETATATGKMRLLWEEQITVMELPHMHVTVNTHILQTNTDVGTQLHTDRGACTQTLSPV